MNYQLCQIDTTVGDLKGNTEKILRIITDKQGHSPQVFIFPELSVSGYPPLDLLDKKSFIKQQNLQVEEILKSTENIDDLIIFGYIEENTGPGRDLYNSALCCYQGKIICNYRKRLLPTYDVFDEARYFEQGTELGLFYFNNKRIGIVICEDLWNDKKYKVNPAKELFEAGVDLVISINASPSVVGKHRQNMIKGLSQQYGLPIIYLNQAGGNDDIVFDGSSFVTNRRGIVTSYCSNFKEEIHEISDTLFEYHLPGWISKQDPEYYESDAQFFYEQAICGIQSYIQKCGFKGVIIGESGGIDSAVVTALAADALGGVNVVGVTMPSQYSSEGSYKDSETLCTNFGTRFYTYPIKDVFDNILNQFNNVFDINALSLPGLMEENMQARIRGQILMAFSNRYGYMVLSTGNKSEMSVGYFTLYGDACGGMAPLSDLYKMEVYAVAQYINKLHGKEMIPQAIIDKEPSAELAPGQKDTDSLPSYPILDSILKYFIEGDTLTKEERDACELIVKGYSMYTEKVLKLIKSAEFKRRQTALTIKMHSKAFGYGRRIPIAQKWNGVV